MSGCSKIVAIFVLVTATIATYANSLTNSFHYDDFHGIVNNPIIRDLRNISLFFTDPSTFSLSHHNDWRPILQITFALNYLIDGLNPSIFRMFNLSIHAGCAILIFLIVAEIQKNPHEQNSELVTSFDTWLAIFAALIFAVHPANSEVVNYIWARSSLLSAFFYLSGFYCFLRGSKEKRDETTSLWRWGMFCFYILGLGTKATAITLPASILLFEFLRSMSRSNVPISFRIWALSRISKFLPLMLIGLVYVALRIILLPESFARVVDYQSITSTTYLFSSIRAWVYYLTLYLWPTPLLVNYHGFGWSTSLLEIRVLVALGIIFLVIGLAWRIRVKKLLVSFFLMWFFITLLPEQSFLPLSEPVNGYRPYLAFAGLSVVLSQLARIGFLGVERITDTRWHLQILRGGRFVVVGGGVCLIILLAMLTARRGLDWRNERTLWSDVLRKDPDNPRAYMNLGLEYVKQGDVAKAKTMLDKALTVAPQNSYAYLLRAYLYQLEDDEPMARRFLTTAVELNPHSAYALFYRAEDFARNGEYAKAINDYRQSLTLKPYFTDAQFGLAMAYLQQGNIGNGERACSRILEVDKHDARAYQCLGRIAMERQHHVQASRVYEKGLIYLPRNQALWKELAHAYTARNMLIEASIALQRSNSFSPDALQ